MILSKKVALITGGTHGIGAETAIHLAKEGTSLCLVARNAPDAAFIGQLLACNVKCHFISADLSVAKECLRVVEETKRILGGIDILVHAAGSAAPGSLLEGSEKAWFDAFDIHIHAAYLLCRSAVPLMVQKKEGAIVFVSSAAGKRGVKNALAYATVKGALPQFTRALAFELAPGNIRVNCVAPGVIRTRFQDYLTAEQSKNNIENRIPLAREGTPDDVAAVICMLIKNEFITGETISVDGGMTMRIV